MTTVTLPRATVEQALSLCEFLWREVVMNDYAEDKREETEAALRAALAQQAELQTTHSSECWRWHHGCAVAKIERQQAPLRALQHAADDDDDSPTFWMALPEPPQDA